MKERIRLRLGRLTRGLFVGLRLLARSWRLWLLTALLGAALAIGWALAQPHRWVSEGYLLLRPLILREGHLLSADELGPSYVVHLIDEGRVARVLAEVEPDASAREILPSLSARALPGGILQLRAVRDDPRSAEALTSGLLRDFRRELEAENRTREEVDRLVIEQSSTRFARRTASSLPIAAAVGGAVGWLAGLILALAAGWLRRRRVVAPLEAEQLLGAPTLATIPPRRNLPF